MRATDAIAVAILLATLIFVADTPGEMTIVTIALLVAGKIVLRRIREDGRAGITLQEPEVAGLRARPDSGVVEDIDSVLRRLADRNPRSGGRRP
jgi:hypothetical protein